MVEERTRGRGFRMVLPRLGVMGSTSMTSLLRTLLLRSTACSVQSAQCCTRPAWRTLASRLYPPLSQWGMFPAVEAEFEKTEKDHLEAELKNEVGLSHSDVYVKDKKVSTSQFELGGMLWQSVGPGLFHLLPLAVRALQRLEQEIDAEMEALGAQKISLSLLSPAAPWQASGRWSEFGDELFRLQDRKRAKLCLSPTHEEAVTTLVASRGHLSPSQLPIRLYQVTTKFRDEQRPRAGPLRAREFMMKDLYTFDVSSNSAAESYAAILASYTRIFHRLDLPVVVAEAAVGAMGGEVSHEFLLPSSLGEDELLSCEECGRAANMEAVQSPQNGMDMCSKCGGPMRTKRAVELGHAFRLGERYSAALGALSTKPGHSPSPLHMCCFGLGLTRILAAAVETLSENRSLVWPRVIAPFQVVVVGPKAGSREETALGQGRAEEVYDALANTSPVLRSTLLLDDRTSLTVGRRVIDAKRLGAPATVVVAKHATEKPGEVEILFQQGSNSHFLALEEAVRFLAKQMM